MKKIVDTLRHLLIPHEDNNFRSKVLHIDFLTVYLIIALVLTFTFKSLQSPLSDVLGYATDITTDKLYQLSNSQRQNNGLGILTYNEKLSQAARQKAQDMFNKNYWAHYGPNGETPWNFILGAGYQYEYAGENLAKNFLFSDGVVDAWMASPTHRENILRPEYTDVGYAVLNGVINGEETTLVVQMFGTPLNNTAVSQPEVQQAIAPSLIPQNIENQTPQEHESKEDFRQLIGGKPVLAHEKSTPIALTQRLSFNVNVVFLGFILLALILDLYFSVKLKVIRISSKNVAHIVFISFIIGGLILVTRGAILQGVTI